MKKHKGLAAAAVAVGLGLGLVPAGCSSSKASDAKSGGCPNGGTVRWGVEPYEEAAQLEPLYKPVAKLLGEKLGCKVEVVIANDYTAEIEAMRSKKLELGEFGPLGYLLANKEAGAKAIATFGDESGKPATYYASIVTPAGSGIQSLAECNGKQFAYSDPASTSGHLVPAYGLKSNGIDPDKDVKGVFPGSHTASFEALRNKKVDCGELNSQTIATATSAGTYKEADFKTLWKSDPIPLDPIAVRGDLPAEFQQKVSEALTSLDLSKLPADIHKKLVDAISGSTIVAQTDSAYDGLRKLVDVLHLDLTKNAG